MAARSWTSGDGPKAIFTDAVGWLRDRDVLLPGVSTLTRLVAQVRDDTTRRLWSVLEGLLTVGRRYVLDQLLEVPPGHGCLIWSAGARARRRAAAAPP